MKYWETIADKLNAAGWSWGIMTAMSTEGGELFVVDAHRDDGNRFVVRSDELLAAFLKLEQAIRSA